MNTKYIFITSVMLLLAGLSSCVKDLDTEPLDPKVMTIEKLFAQDSALYEKMLAKCYAGLVVTGQRGQWGLPEIANGDEGVTSFLRVYWCAQVLPTDEAINVWGDGDLNEYHLHSWSDANSYIKILYQRIFFNISVCNEFLRNVMPRIDGASPALKADLNLFVAEARFLRALYYYFAMDLWGNVPFATEDDRVGAFNPRQIKRADLFKYIETELKEIDAALMPANRDAAFYARANKAAAWAVLAKMYLNAEVYTGTPRYTDCISYCNKITDAGYALHTKYPELFLTDNNTTAINEIIFPIADDGTNSQNYGGMTFLVNAAVGGAMKAADFGISGGWAGNLTTTTLINKFADPSGNTDTRAMFFGQGNNLAMLTDLRSFSDALAVTKYKNISSTGADGSDKTFVDSDFPLFRLADIYLAYAEAHLRGGAGGNASTALTYVNEIRNRANAAAITTGELTLDFLLDERARELYWECHRRTDLIRFGKFTENYMWDWKGGVPAGKNTASHLNLYPLPASDMSANSNLVQNEGYVK